ncbi:cardiolipin synthase [Salinibacillus xinjiangensis]|uniref:Cardiolipin synthase n=1 Tax=Salinibacillus xinjiangensis TaxID=1229268 RepID=A0A6G1X855_9BACI|nr:cardiolipin synthase [Salinibacillus xinjiangensis]MRG87085.1 cardiolipin synthase [Salinibacillus xinjiangensis]
MFKRVQFLVFFVLVAATLYVITEFWGSWIVTVYSVFISISVIFIAFLIFIENRNPSQTLNWLLVLAAFPGFGFFFYLLFGQNFRKRKMFKQKAELDLRAFKQVEGSRLFNQEEIKQMGDHQHQSFRLAQKLGNSPISFNTETKVLTNGLETFPAMLNELKNAEHHIHLEFYIVRDDDLGKEFKDLLIEKAKNGVEVRFLYDAVGSWELSQSFKGELQAAGAEVVPFSPVRLPFLNNKINFRNHRKIIVIDGKIGFVGGLNIGDEYIGRNEYYGNWRDTHLYMRGEAVRSLQTIFLQDWFYMTGKALLKPVYRSPEYFTEEMGGVQLIAGGPDNQWEVIKMLFFSLMTSAKGSIWIASPYFIPDEDILSAMKIAALSGVDVKLLVPNRPDKKIVYYASQSYYPELLEAGVQIYKYNEGFLHSKIMIVDQELASIGTSNMDMRSFHLNFEVNAFLYKTESTDQLVADYITDIEHSTKLELEEFNKRPIYKKLYESLCRLLSPLL